MEKDKEEELKNQWKFLATVIDRLCLIFFSTFTLISVFVIFVVAAN